MGNKFGLFLKQRIEEKLGLLDLSPEFCARDLKRVEDVDSSAADHAADAVRYGCLRQRQGAFKAEIMGF